VVYNVRRIVDVIGQFLILTASFITATAHCRSRMRNDDNENDIRSDLRHYLRHYLAWILQRKW